jgi:hypothetical protein
MSKDKHKHGNATDPQVDAVNAADVRDDDLDKIAGGITIVDGVSYDWRTNVPMATDG